MHFTEAARTATDLQVNLAMLLIIAIGAALVPLAVGLLRLRVAEVVLLLGFGILVGPQVLGLVEMNETLDTFTLTLQPADGSTRCAIWAVSATSCAARRTLRGRRPPLAPSLAARSPPRAPSFSSISAARRLAIC